MASNPLVGAWRLVSYELRDEEGQVTYPFGEQPLGYILYTDNGYMSVAFMPSGRPHFSTEDSMGGTDEEKVIAAETYRSYAGRYELQSDRVIHHIEVCLFPNWVGKDQVRLYDLKGDRLYLSTLPNTNIYRGKKQTGHLIWERT